MSFPHVFVLHFPSPDRNPAHSAGAEPGHRMGDIVRRLQEAGLQTVLEWDSTHDSVFCRIGCTCVPAMHLRVARLSHA